jgi:hypothetical protein
VRKNSIGGTVVNAAPMDSCGTSWTEGTVLVMARVPGTILLENSREPMARGAGVAAGGRYKWSALWLLSEGW